MAPPAPGCAHLSGTTPTPVGGDGHQHGTRRQRAATAIAPIVKELIYTIHSQGRGWQSTSAERCVCDVKSCSEGPRFGSGIAIDIRKVPGTALKNQTTGKVVYTPPEGQARLRDLLANWERFLHDDSDLDPLIRMAVGHYQFEAIHPFTDGNGRTGRILNLLFLVEQGLLDQPVLYLSRAIIKRRTE
jgi:hypothetical protein